MEKGECLEREDSGLVGRPRKHARALPLGDRHRLPGEHGLVDGRRAADNLAVHRHGGTRLDEQELSDDNLPVKKTARLC